ncbi:CopG family transcriptional regulator [Flavobacterium sp. KBS0721]|jgi:antitoxin ParD1/3/4|uniref:ribbon-helix-helix domain-containing protein n=1 Tax=Flavobacterium sp. KBS0721 TaxID=1179672 RepID=UPI00098F962B|nr:CopG family transcriptional regulator [Flavobacterium sp. KBS0721]QDW22261.1 CopG family transcriptional regulator [Flavobacterium sp. KBS0721]
MTRQSISLTAPNEEWLKNQVKAEEFSSKSEAINYLIKQARTQEEYYEFVRAKIDKGEKSGLTKKQTREEMLAEFKEGLPNV